MALRSLLSALFLLVPALASAAPPLAGSRPNIILVMTDDQGYAPLHALGHPWLRTPNLDRLHARSTRFDEFLVSPTCSPTRAALMTGRHPMRNGITHTIFERERMTLKATTIAEVLRDAGYETGIFGKWHLGDEEAHQPHKRGFTEAFIHGAGGIGQNYGCSCADAPGNKYFDPVIRHNGRFEKTHGFCTDVFFRQALGWINKCRKAKKPFFAYIATNAPHGPFIAPPKNRERFEKLGFARNTAGFYGMVENIDENVGLMLEKLAEWKLEENTLVIFISDNGTTGGAKGGRGGRKNRKNAKKPAKPKKDANLLGTGPDGTRYEFWNAGLKGMKGSVNEGGVRVPAFFSWKGRIAPGRDIKPVVRHIDIFPTLAALAGAKVPGEQVEGRSLLPLLENPDADWPDRFLFFHTGRWPKGANPDDFQWRNYAVRNQRFLVLGKYELYDMQADIGQTNNVAKQHPEVIAKALAAYEKWWRKTRPLMVNEDVPNSTRQPYAEACKKQMKEGGIPDWQPPEL
jgi:arylsulfatase